MAVVSTGNTHIFSTSNQNQKYVVDQWGKLGFVTVTPTKNRSIYSRDIYPQYQVVIMQNVIDFFHMFICHDAGGKSGAGFNALIYFVNISSVDQ